MVYSAPCFSGTCGFCVNCCSNYSDSDLQTRLSGSSGIGDLRRYSDISKFLGKSRVERITLDYNQSLNRWCRERGFRCPTETGSTKEHIVGTNNLRFDLVKKNHGLSCIDSHCRVMYVSSPERLHSTLYPTFPIYTNNERSGLAFCGPCLTRLPVPPSISDY